MDIGGVWNGTTEVTATTGDTFQFTVCNTAPNAGDIAYTITASAVLPANFSYVANTANGIPGITATQVGTALTFNIPGDVDVTTGTCATIGFGLNAGTAVGAGTYPINYTLGFGTTDHGSDGSLPILQNVLVQAGAATIVKGPANQLVAVGGGVSWAVTVTNTGGGGMFGVSIDESAIDPGPTISFSTMAQLAPATPLATTVAAKMTLPYLYPGVQYTSTVTAVVTGCLNLNNTATVDDRTHVSAGSASTQVLLDFLTPLVTFSAPAIVLNNLASTPVSVLVSNTGHGDARSVVLATTLTSYPVTVSGVSAGWSYDTVSGSFTMTANGGTLSNMSNNTLTFNIAPSAAGQCTPPGGGLYFITGNYTDVCSNPYVNPVSFNNLSASYTQPSLALGVASPGGITAPVTNVVSTVTVTITRPDLIASNPIVVVDTLPANVATISIGALSGGQTATCPSGPCNPGDPVTWSIPNPGGAGTQVYNLYITYNVPSVTCADGQFSIDLATVSAYDAFSCEYTAQASASSILTNTVSTNVTTGYTESYSIGGGVHETGLPNYGGGRGAGQGAFIPISSTYTFPSGYGGTWAGSFYTDNFGGASTMTLVPNSLMVSWDGGAAVPVPGASILVSTGQLYFTAGFLAGPSYVSSPNVQNHTVSFTYEATVSDIVLGALSATTLTHFSDFDVAGASGACTTSSLTRIIQYASDPVARASESLSLAMPSVIDMCQVFTATATITGSNFNAYLSSAVVVTNSSYSYLTPQTPDYGGLYTSGNVTYSENSGAFPVFSYTGAGTIGAGSFGVQMHRRATAATNNASVGVSAAYDDWQLDPYSPPGAPLSLSASATPVLTQKGHLVLTATPQAVSVTGNQVQWVIYANNAGSGGIYGATIKDIIPAGLTINVSSTNLQNPNYPVTVSGTTATWTTLNGVSPINIAAGSGIAITVVADVAGGICSIPTGTSAEEGVWGCDATNAEDILNSNPSFTFPTGSIQAVHDSVNTFTELCAFNYDTMIVRNTGLATVYNLQMQEILNPLSTGIDIVPNSVQVSTNGGATWNPLGAAGNPTGDGSSINPYTWATAQVAQLASIAPFGSGSYSNVELRVEITASESTNGLQPSVTTKANGTTACGQPVADPGTPYTLLVEKPNMTLTKVGQNVTAGQVGFSNTVYGGQGDQIVWQITAHNTGNQPADHLRLLEILASDGGSASYTSGVSGNPPVTSGSTVLVSTLAAPGSNTYTVSETLGPTCVAAVNTANVSWGCVENSLGAISDLNTPTTSTATAGLVMTPQFLNASSLVTFNALPGGRSEVVIHFVNTGGTAQGLTIVSTIPAVSVQELDPTSTPTFTTNGAITAMNSIGTLISPAYAFTGNLRNGDYLELRYRMIQTNDFDTTTSSFSFPDSVGAATDPSLPPSGPLSAEIDFSNTCSGASSQTITGTLAPPTPDINIVTMTPGFETLTAGTPYNFVYTLENQGQALSIADNINFSLQNLGSGWSAVSVALNTAGTGGSAGTCPGNVCPASQIGTLAQNQSAVITVTATPLDNGQPLTFAGLAVGTIFTDNGTNWGSNYTYDAAAPKVVGVSVSKSLLSTSEPTTSTGTLAIGEEATFQLQAHWFGGANVSTITVRDSLPAGLGFVSFSTTTGHDQPIPTQRAPVINPVNTGVISLTIPDFVGNGTFLVNLVARALNIGGNTNGLIQTNNMGVKFDSNGQTFASNSAADGFGGTLANLHSSTTTTIGLPILTFNKQVEDVSTGGPYGTSEHATGGDFMQYQVTLTNTGGAPAFNGVIADALATPKLLLTSVADGGTFDLGAGGIVNSGSVTYNNGNMSLSAGQSLGELDPGQSVTVTYQAQVDDSATPNDSLFNGATFYASSLPGVSGSESSNPGTAGSATGQALYTGQQSASVIVTSITFAKTLTATSLGVVSTNVVVGEQVQFQLTLVMPPGTTPGLLLSDNLPAGLRLVQTPAVTLGSAISPVVPSITPAVPADGPVNVEWNFGTVTVGSNTTNAERTIMIPYVAEVDNIAAVVGGATMVNGSSYTYVGSLPVNLSSVTLGVVESSGAVSVVISPAANITAGQIIVATITVANAGHATADGLNIVVTLPFGLSYLPTTTSDISGPAVGEPDAPGSQLIYGRNQGSPQTINVSTATPLKFQIELVVQPGVLPNEPQTVTVADDWLSLPLPQPGPNLGPAVGAPGTASGERNGSGGSLDKYFSISSVTVTAGNTYSVSKSSSPGTNPDLSYRVGDTIQYTVQATFQAGTVLNARINDTLPAGLAFNSLLSVSPSSGTGGFAYTVPSGSSEPISGATGVLNFYFGGVTNNGPGSAPLTLVYTVNVLDPGGIPANPSKVKLINAARLLYNDYVPSAKLTSVSGSTVTVEQPSLRFGKVLQTGQSTTVGEGSPVQYEVTVTNAGAGPGYDVTVQDTLPVGLRNTVPTITSATLNGIGITPLTNLAYTHVAGVLTWTLTDAQVLNGSVANSTPTLKIDYTATVDAGEGAMEVLTNGAMVTASYSLPGDTGRSYAASASSSATVGTATPAGIGKFVSFSSMTIGASPAYTIIAPTTTINVPLYNVEIKDVIPAALTGLTYGNNSGSLAPGVCGSVSVTDNSVGNSLDLIYNCLPPGTQAVVTATATIQDISGNNAGGFIVNSASYTWEQIPAGTPSTAVSSTVATLITEPALAITKTFISSAPANPAQGLQANDTITYRIKVVNGSGPTVAPAYNLAIYDVSDQNLITPNASPDNTFPGNNPGVPTNEGISGGNATFLWNVAGPLQPGATYAFDVTFTLGPNVQPNETLLNFSSVTWTSLSGGGRNDTGGLTPPDNYVAGAPASVSAVVGPAHMEKAVKAPGGTTYEVGQPVTYRLTFTFGQGIVNNVNMLDILPANMVYDSVVLTPSNVQVNPSGAVSILSGPSAGATGLLTFSLGNIESNGANPTVFLDVTAHATNVGGNVNNTNLTNGVEGLITSSTGGVVGVYPANGIPTITIIEPSLSLAKALDVTQSANVLDGSPVKYVVTITNAGAGAANDVQVQDTLPSGMRMTTPVASSATLNGVGILPSLAQSYTALTGVVQWTLTDAQILNGSITGSTITLRIAYTAQLDGGAGAGSLFTNAAQVTQYFSRPASAPTDRRQYAATPTQSVTVYTPFPSGIGKAVSLSSPTIGASLAYTITVPTTTLDTTLYNVRVQDVLPAGLSIVSHGNNSGAIALGPCPSIIVTDNTVGNSVDLTYSCLPPNTQAVVSATATVKDIVGNVAGTSVSNTASYTWTQTPAGSVEPSVSTTVVSVIAEPALAITKIFLSSAPANPVEGLQANDQVTYRIKIVNGSGANVAPAYNLAIYDVSDQNLITPAASADTTFPGNNPGAPANLGISGGNATFLWNVGGPLQPGATYAFDVTFTLGPGVQPMETLLNTSSVTWTSLSGGGRNDTGGLTPPDDYIASNPSPVAVIVGPVHMEKSIKAPGGTTYEVGQPVVYHLPFTFGQGTVDGVNVLDILPANMAYDSVALSVNHALTSLGGAVSIISGPSAGATGVLTFNLGSLESSGANPEVDLDVTVHATNVGGNVNNTNLTNGVEALVTSSTGGVVGIGPMSGVPTITVIEPALSLTKALAAGQSANVLDGSPVNYVVTAINGGTGAAYDITVQDTLPYGLRVVTPVVTSATLNGIGITPLSNLTQSYTEATGVLQWTLTDSQILNASITGSTETLVIAYTATVDARAGAGRAMTNAAQVTQYFSQPSADVARRQYAATPTQSTTVNTPAPAGIGKAVSFSSATIGANLAYTITVPTTTADTALYNVEIKDVVPPAFSGVTHGNNAASLAPGPCPAITITDNSVGNSLDVIYSCLPPNTQAVVSATGTIRDIVGNVAGNFIVNSASYTYTTYATGPAQPAVSTTVASVITEPVLGITKAFLSSSTVNPSEGLEAGDKVTYRITIANGAGANVAPAYNLALYDIADQNLLTPSASVDPNYPGSPSPGSPTNLGITAGYSTFLWNIAGPLEPGATYQYDIQFTLGAGVQPMETLLNMSSVTWASLPAGGRNDAGGLTPPDDYVAGSTSPVAIVVGPAHIEKKIMKPGVTTYAVGQTVVYDLKFSFNQGTVDGVQVFDALPAGLVYSTAAIVTHNAQAGGGGAVKILSGPAAGATGSLDFNLGALQSSGSSPTVHINVSAIVQNVGGNLSGTLLTNGVSAELTSSTGGVVGVGPMNGLPTITVTEPKLVLAHDGPAGDTTDLGGISTFTIRIGNFGTSAAYQPTVQVQIGVGMQAASPASRLTTAVISGGRSLSLVAGTDYTLSYNAGTGLLTYAFTSAISTVAVGETLTLTYEASVDNNAVNGTVLDSTAAVTQYYSADTSAGVGANTRVYTNSLAASTGHLADGAVLVGSDNFGDDAPVTVRAPVLNVSKSVTPYPAVLPQNTTLTWGLSIANAGPIASSGSVLTDDLGAFTPTSMYISSGSMSSVIVTGAGGAYVDSSLASGGTTNKGLVSLSNLIIPAASTVTVSFSVNISSVIPNSTKIYNRATFTVPGFTAPFISASTRTADGSGPTAALINSIPGFVFDKTAVVVGGGALVDGSTITYTMVIRNEGTERSLNSVLTDAIPADTKYVPGSTTLNGAPVADIRGASPLSSGLAVNSPGETSGILDVYSGLGEADVTFRVSVETGVPSGSAISNQGLLTGQGEGTGTPIARLSDDPTTVPSPDPTVLIVSGEAYLVSEKTSVINAGPALLDYGLLTYTIAVRNLGNVAAAHVVLTDVTPANTAYVPGTILFGVGASTPVAMAAQTDAADGDSADYGVTTASAVTVNIGTVPANGQASIVFQVKVASAAPNGTIIANQASISAPALPTILSDGDGNHANGNQPTYNVVGSTGAPSLVQTKQVLAVRGGTVEPRSQLQYLITTTNIGNSTATNVTVTDPVPGANSWYSTGTTQLNGVVLADAGLISPLVAGYNLGSLNPGQSALITYRVRVSSMAAAGTNVDNRASYTAGPGTITGQSCSDRTDCITRVQVGGAPGAATVSGRVWLDLNHDRVYVNADPTYANWLVQVVLNGNVVASGRTAADGTYTLTGIPPGTGYQIQFRNPTSNVVYGQAISSIAGTVLTDGTIRNLTLNSGDNDLNQSLPLDPNGVLYDSIRRTPIAGAVVFLTGPAGFNPALHLLPGQNGQTTDATGLYRFDINFGAGAPLGVYSLQMAAPPGYLTSFPGTPSTLIPPTVSVCGAITACLTVPVPPAPDPDLIQAQNTAPAVGQPTPYFTSYNFTANPSVAVVNDHIPLDPVLANAIFITKTAAVTDVSKGDLVAYTITARNTVATTLTNINLIDLTPPGFTYRAGSARLNGVPAGPVVVGRQLTWSGLTFGIGETKTFTLLLTVGSGVGYGKYINQAYAINSLVNSPVSNEAAATVRVTPDPTLDCTDIVGKVFDDANANGYQDEGERGLPNVRVVTARGWLIDTDSEGRFHIACAAVPNQDRGTNFIMKLDETTLPTGYRVTTENPRVIRLTSGKFARIDFGAALFQVVRLDLSAQAFAATGEAPRVPEAPAPPRWVVVVDSATVPPIYFAVGKFNLNPARAAEIRADLDRLRAQPDVRNVRLKVVGHTDSTVIKGTLKTIIGDNWNLSRSRAKQLAAELIEKLHISSETISSEGRADTEPAATNATVEGRALNRRSVVELVYERLVDKTQVDSGSEAKGDHWEVVVESGTIESISVSLDRLNRASRVRNINMDVRGRVVELAFERSYANAPNGPGETPTESWKTIVRTGTMEEMSRVLDHLSLNSGVRDIRLDHQGGRVHLVYSRFIHNGVAKTAEAPAMEKIRPAWQRAVDHLMVPLDEKPSVLRLGYCRGSGEKLEEARFRLWQVADEVRSRWKSKPDRYALTIEQELDGTACAGDAP
jgi:uncharacterized repeat protein (TIGR01451 family)/fimbrial isopeptide formation D2 family protein